MRGVTGWTQTLAVIAAVAAMPGAVNADANARPAIGFSFDCETATADPVEAAEFSAEVGAKIGAHWNLGGADAEMLDSRITLRLCLGRDGSPQRMLLLAADGPTEGSVTRLYETARRAIMRAHEDGGLPLPRDGYVNWRVLDLVFDAKGMRER